jgi:hypothetical protein
MARRDAQQWQHRFILSVTKIEERDRNWKMIEPCLDTESLRNFNENRRFAYRSRIQDFKMISIIQTGWARWPD